MTTPPPGSRGAAQALDEIEAALKRTNAELTVPAAEYVPAIPAAWKHLEAALAALAQARIDFRGEADRGYAAGWNASRAALAPPADGEGEVEEIKLRHEAALARMADNNWPMSEGRQDVAALLAIVDKRRAGQ